MPQRNPKGRLYRRGGSPCWWADYYQQGKRVRVSTDETDERQAAAWLKRRMALVTLGRGPKSGALTVGNALALVRLDYETRNLRTTSKLKSPMDKLLDWWGAGFRAETITPERVRAYVRDRKRDGGAQNSIRIEIHLLSRGIKLAVRAGRLDPMAVPFIPLVPHDESTIRRDFLSQGDLERVCLNLNQPLDDYVRWLFYTGWRRSEVSTLTWADYDPAQRAFRLRAEHSKTKTPRIVPAVGPLDAILERRLAARLPRVPWVFHYRLGIEARPVGEHRKALQTACVSAGVPAIRFHGLRRSCAKYWVEAGVDPNRVMALTGHRSSAMFRRYQIVDVGSLRSMLEAAPGYERPGLGYPVRLHPGTEAATLPVAENPVKP